MAIVIRLAASPQNLPTHTPPSHPSYLSTITHQTAQHRTGGGGPAGLLGGGGAKHRAGGGRGGQALLGGERADHLPIRELVVEGWVGERGGWGGGGCVVGSLLSLGLFLLGPCFGFGRGVRRDCMCKTWGEEAARAFFLGRGRGNRRPLPHPFWWGGVSLDRGAFRGQGAGGHRVGVGDTGCPRSLLPPPSCNVERGRWGWTGGG